MTKHWKRRFEVDVAGQHLKLDDMQVEVQIRLVEVEHPPWAYVRIINLSSKTSSAIFQKSAPIQINGGYHEGPYGMLFDGVVRDMRRGKLNGTDTYHDIIAQSGATAYTYATVNTTIKAGQTVQDVADAAIQALQEKEKDLKRGYMDPALAQKTLVRSWPLNTEARNVLRSVANSTDTSWVIENNELRIASNKKGLPGTPPEINATTGMIGIPEQQLYGIVVRVLMNPHYKLQQMVHIDSSVINRFLEIGAAVQRDVPRGTLIVPLFSGGANVVPGISPTGMYRIIRIDHDGTMRGQPWYTTLTCLDPNQEGTVVSPSSGVGASAGDIPTGQAGSGRDLPETDDKAGDASSGR